MRGLDDRVDTSLGLDALMSRMTLHLDDVLTGTLALQLEVAAGLAGSSTRAKSARAAASSMLAREPMEPISSSGLSRISRSGASRSVWRSHRKAKRMNSRPAFMS